MLKTSNKIGYSCLNRLTSIEQNVSRLTVIESEMQHLRSGMANLQMNNTQITTRLTEVEKSCQGISSMFDDSRVVTENLSSEVKNLKRENEKLKSEATKFDQKCEMYSNEISELKARSMQQNLVFYGLAESPYGTVDNTESKIRDFLRTELELEEPNFAETVVFDRVHRIGRRKRYQGAKPRPIVARFERYRDREVIRSAAKDLNAKENGYNIREQFPPEMEEKRKKLYPVMRKALQNPKNRVFLVRDKLIINGEQYIPPPENAANSNPVEPDDQSRRGIRLNDRGRRYAQGVRSKPQNQQYGVSTFNHFESLAGEQCDSGFGSMRTGKRVLSSPEQDDSLLKRSRDIETVPKCSIEDENNDETSLQSVGANDEQGPVNLMDFQSETEPVTSCENTSEKTQTITVEVHSEFGDSSCLTGPIDNENSVDNDVSA